MAEYRQMWRNVDEVSAQADRQIARFNQPLDPRDEVIRGLMEALEGILSAPPGNLNTPSDYARGWNDARFAFKDRAADAIAAARKLVRQPVGAEGSDAVLRKAASILRREIDRVKSIFPEMNESNRVVSLSAVEEEYEMIEKEILSLIEKPEIYMGQIMAECDCQRRDECQRAGRCIAEVR